MAPKMYARGIDNISKAIPGSGRVKNGRRAADRSRLRHINDPGQNGSFLGFVSSTTGSCQLISAGSRTPAAGDAR